MKNNWLWIMNGERCGTGNGLSWGLCPSIFLVWLRATTETLSQHSHYLVTTYVLQYNLINVRSMGLKNMKFKWNLKTYVPSIRHKNYNGLVINTNPKIGRNGKYPSHKHGKTIKIMSSKYGYLVPWICFLLPISLLSAVSFTSTSQFLCMFTA